MFQFVGTFSVDVDVLARKSQSIQNNLSVLRVSKLWARIMITMLELAETIKFKRPNS